MSTSAPPGLSNLQILFTLAVGLIFSVETLLGFLPLNGAANYQDIGLAGTGAAMIAPLLAVGWVVWRLERPGYLKWLLLGILTLANFFLQIAGTLADPRGIGLIRQIILSPGATSYFNDALNIDGLPAWLGRYNEVALTLHSTSHPPGPIIFCWFLIKLFGPVAGAWLCGCALGLAGAAGVLVIHKFAGLWTTDPKARMLASAVYALMPVLLFFFPEFDQIYPILSMLLVMLWSWTLVADSGAWPRLAMILGGVLFVASFFVYQVLAIGVFMVVYGQYWLWRQRSRLAAAGKFLRAAGLAFAVCAGIYAALWIATGYNPIASFLHAANVNHYYINLHKPGEDIHSPYALYNLYVFAMGMGVMVVPIAFLHAGRIFDRFQADPADIPLTLMAIASILAIDLTGLFAGETDREWLFLAPLVAVPVGIEIARLAWRWRVLVFAMQAWILVCMRARISFIAP